MTDLKTYPHLDLINQCKLNDRQSQHKIYELYAKSMFNVCYRIVNQYDEAQDVLQESFVKMFTQIESYREESSFGSWFKRIVVNNSLNHIKKRKSEQSKFELLRNETENYTSDFEEETIPQASIVEVQNALELLPEGYRLVFTLYLFEEYSHKEIAEELGITESTSKSQLNRAKKKIKEIINNKQTYERN